ncbi:hypothetical protein ABBQ38_007454 [Trebouxia sp. C0009 RCD-2024]
MAYIRAQATNGYLLFNDKFLAEKFSKKWGNARAAHDRKANKELAEKYAPWGAESTTQPSVLTGPLQPAAVVTVAASRWRGDFLVTQKPSRVMSIPRPCPAMPLQCFQPALYMTLCVVSTS